MLGIHKLKNKESKISKIVVKKNDFRKKMTFNDFREDIISILKRHYNKVQTQSGWYTSLLPQATQPVVLPTPTLYKLKERFHKQD